MLLTVRSAAVYELSSDAYMCLMVEPPLVGSSYRVQEERLFTSPTTFCELSRDLYGNPLRRLIAAKGTSTSSSRQRSRRRRMSLSLPTRRSNLRINSLPK